jgi:hypothetical protein
MKSCIHLVAPELFLPREIAAQACADLRLPALQALLARAEHETAGAESLESALCAAFGANDGAIAPVTLLADGGHPGEAYWLRADPVHLISRGNEIILHPVASLDAEEAAQFCADLNRHFAEEGLHFIAPRPDQWYLRLAHAPDLVTHPLARVAGRDIRHHLPQGSDALRWHSLLNEIQMLLYNHAVNAAREARGDWIINSIWPWGGGYAPENLRQPSARVYTDSPLAEAFAQAAGLSPVPLPGRERNWVGENLSGALVVWDGLRLAWQHGDIAAWRVSLQALEHHCAAPLLIALRRGKVEKVTLEALQEGGSQRFTLTPRTAWRIWRLSGGLEQYPARLM